MSVDVHAEQEAKKLNDRSVKQAIFKGIKCRCPSCGEGKLFNEWLKVTPVCSNCGEELFHERAQDFPPYITISIVGHIVVTLLMIVEANFEWSMNTHLAVWIPLGFGLALAMMQPIKGGVVGMQWALRMFGFSGEPQSD